MYPAPIESLRSPTTVGEVLQQFADSDGTLRLADGQPVVVRAK
jgi:hypothetical protein